jgi:hypothetical protein
MKEQLKNIRVTCEPSYNSVRILGRVGSHGILLRRPLALCALLSLLFIWPTLLDVKHQDAR